MDLPESLIHTLQHMKFQEPTQIQVEAIPLALQGRDILGSAQTGTGKTAAFGIPLITKILNNPTAVALVITPTRELATQVIGQLQIMMGKQSKINTSLLIGGEPMPKQLSRLRLQPRIIVGTPGRINDHLKRGSLRLDQANFLVLDETDRMLDMGFSVQIKQIIKSMHADRQTLLFSATLPQDIVQIAEQYLRNPARVAVKSSKPLTNHIPQDMINVSEAEKYDTLLAQLDKRQGSIILFVKTKHGTEKMAIRLAKHGHSTNAIHGDLKQNKRAKVISAFRDQKHRILVATDVAARGLDIPHIEHVINYDMPQCPEDYVHRIGRTARAGAKGEALNLVTPADQSKWRMIVQLLNPGTQQTSSTPFKKSRNDGVKPMRSKSPSAGRSSRPYGEKSGPSDAKGTSPANKPFKRTSKGKFVGKKAVGF